MTDINLKTLTPDTSLPTTGFLFGADSQASTNPSVYSTQTVATTLLGSTSLTGDVLTASAPVLDLAQTWNSSGTTFTGVRFNAAGTSDANSAAASLLMDLQVNTASKFKVNKSGTVTVISGSATEGSQAINFASNTAVGLYASGSQLYFTGNGVNFPQQIFSTSFININNDTSTFRFGTSFDLILGRKAAANLRLGAADAASPVAQTLSVQSVVAGATTNPAGADFTITGSQGLGSGAGGSIIFKVAPAGTAANPAQNTLLSAMTIASNRNVTFDKNILGLSYIEAGSAFGFFMTNRSGIVAPSDGVLKFSNNAENDFNRIQFGGTTSSFPALKRSTTFLQARLADDSAFAGFASANVQAATAYTVATLPGTPGTGMIARVSDASAPVIGTTVAGGGAAYALVNYNGANWTVIGV